MHVVATAGHVDHGKSSLVAALTGMVPDRLAEELRRGLSIELGYCWTRIDGAGDVVFVDVPGHERFVTTALSGLGPVPTVVLAVAADDPWMPQAAEHVDALDALGVRHGVVVITRSDLADPAPALARARAALAPTSLRDLPAVCVSSRTGVGLERLRRLLGEVLAAVPEADPTDDVRLWVDRRFHVRGTGTVVTGTLPAGTLRPGDVLELHGPDRPGPPARVRVRGLECLGESVGSVSGVARVALDLGGRAPEELDRGQALVTPDAFEPSRLVDVRLVGVRSGDGRIPQQPLLHVGATSVGVHARELAGDVLRLRLERPLPLRIGDRAVLRDPGSRGLWGVRVLDPVPPALTRRGAAGARVAALAGADGSLADELGRRGVADRSLLRRVGATGGLPDDAVTAGDWVVSGTRARDLRARLAAEVLARSTDVRPGVALGTLTRLLGLPDDRLTAALVAPPLRRAGGEVLPPRDPDVPAAAERGLEGLRADLTDRPFAAPDAARLAELGLASRELAQLARAGRVLRLGEGVVLLADAADRAVTVLECLPQPFTVSEARSALASSRRVVVPLLNHLDRTGRTVRLADDRRRLR